MVVDEMSIRDRLWEALPRILSAGLTTTIPLTLVSFTLALSLIHI